MSRIPVIASAALVVLFEARAGAQPAPPPPPPAPAAAAAADPADEPRVVVTGEVRSRGEVFRDPDLEQVLLRTRLGVAGEAEGVAAVIVLQDARLWGEEPTTAADTEGVDLYQGYLSIALPGSEVATLDVGRMELSYGAQRLIGGFGWSNTGRAFDAVRLRYRPVSSVAVDGFFARLHQDRTVTRTLGDDFAGVYGTFTAAGLTADGYLLYLHDRGGLIDLDDDGVGDVERFAGGGRYHLVTPGARVVADLGAGLSVDAEAAVQLGRRGDQDILAWATHAQLGYALDVAGKPAVAIGGDFASGDADPDDDRFGTFENLFPTNHLFYGYLDLAAWKNLIDGYLEVSAEPLDRVKARLAVHALARLETEDTFYRASGAPLVPLAVASVLDERYVGTEVDLTVVYKVTPALGLLAGASYLRAGAFLDAAEGGAAADPLFLYLQVTGAFSTAGD
jgi:hypothetical protein